MSGLSPPNSLSYTGQIAVPSINRTFPPTTSFNDFNVPTIWTDTLAMNAYILVAKPQGVAEWVLLGGEPGSLETLTGDSGGAITPDAGNINILGGSTGLTFAGNSGTATLSLTGTLAVANGGTGDTTLTNHSVLLGQGTSAVAFAGPNASTHALFLSAGAAADPAFTTTGTPYMTGLSFNSGTDVLSTYHTASYVPALTFGGSSTGITYTTQTGNYTQIGNLVFCSMHILLSSKGSSTGIASINLPVTNSSTPLSSGTFSAFTGLTLPAGFTNVGGYMQSANLNLTASGSGVPFTGLDDTMFSNTTDLYASFFYFAA